MIFIFPFGDAIKSEIILNNEVIHTISGRIEEVCAGSRHQEQGQATASHSNLGVRPSAPAPDTYLQHNTPQLVWLVNSDIWFHKMPVKCLFEMGYIIKFSDI